MITVAKVMPTLGLGASVTIKALLSSWSPVHSIGQVKCIVMKNKEIFDGNGYEISLPSFSTWEGFVTIAGSGEEAPTSLEDAPIIRNVHMVGGQTSTAGGFIVRSYQTNFIVESCSSTGVIDGRSGKFGITGGGGICGHGCSGEIRITNCWSSGEILGGNAGGIIGKDAGINGGHVEILHCHSTGDISGDNAGGIIGSFAGYSDGQISIIHSYSEGAISGSQSGGICGRWGAFDAGYVSIRECYSLGDISGTESGGIAGRAAGENGAMLIQDSFTLGNIINSNHAGGITGYNTGFRGGRVTITNVYASGTVRTNAGGIIGHIATAPGTLVSVAMSVYNGEGGRPMVGGGGAAIVNEKKKNQFGGIRSYKRHSLLSPYWLRLHRVLGY